MRGERGNGRDRGTCPEKKICHYDGHCKVHCSIDGSQGDGTSRGSCAEGLRCHKDGGCKGKCLHLFSI